MISNAADAACDTGGCALEDAHRSSEPAGAPGRGRGPVQEGRYRGGYSFVAVRVDLGPNLGTERFTTIGSMYCGHCEKLLGAGADKDESPGRWIERQASWDEIMRFANPGSIEIASAWVTV